MDDPFFAGICARVSKAVCGLGYYVGARFARPPIYRCFTMHN